MLSFLIKKESKLLISSYRNTVEKIYCKIIQNSLTTVSYDLETAGKSYIKPLLVTALKGFILNYKRENESAETQSFSDDIQTLHSFVNKNFFEFTLFDLYRIKNTVKTTNKTINSMEKIFEQKIKEYFNKEAREELEDITKTIDSLTMQNKNVLNKEEEMLFHNNDYCINHLIELIIQFEKNKEFRSSEIRAHYLVDKTLLYAEELISSCFRKQEEYGYLIKTLKRIFNDRDEEWFKRMDSKMILYFNIQSVYDLLNTTNNRKKFLLDHHLQIIKKLADEIMSL